MKDLTLSRNAWACVAHDLAGTPLATRILATLNGNLFTRDMVSLALNDDDRQAARTSWDGVKHWDKERYGAALEAVVNYRNQDRES